MKKVVLLLIFLKCVGLSAQAPIDTFSYLETLDIPYLAPEDILVDSLQCLNLVLPKNVERPPLLLWIGGGAWSFVDRNVEMNLARKFAREGIAVAAVGHRLSRGLFRDSLRTSGVIHPAHIEDIAASFKWLYDHAEAYGYDRNKIVVGGFSSGAHLCALLAMDERYLARHGLSPSHIKGIIPVAGTFDIDDYYSVFLNSANPDNRPLAVTHVKDVFGNDESQFREASPVHYIEKLNTPMLLISERALYNYTKLFEEKLREANYENGQVFHVFNFNHGGLWRDISNAPNSQTRNLMIDFIYRITK